ncbi:hypothetical protein MEA186_23356 [Mesorhizobium amorphae CCNWGS0123]|uniref:Uncharacterized protein n=1 Tax=Mesorhizobium amorphae CCNWGS0123 TaxID=1082933 RepID=G6YFC4_9HYPH|nr:hypothetical protein A6B35_32815 [Mesorhizobium amorphae CCNWGS0123]EHH09605.1 hypothetical protein MEA186_23356 [Mesorhizobium amorphae CCNWGS0123]
MKILGVVLFALGCAPVMSCTIPLLIPGLARPVGKRARCVQVANLGVAIGPPEAGSQERSRPSDNFVARPVGKNARRVQMANLGAAIRPKAGNQGRSRRPGNSRATWVLEESGVETTKPRRASTSALSGVIHAVRTSFMLH